MLENYMAHPDHPIQIKDIPELDDCHNCETTMESTSDTFHVYACPVCHEVVEFNSCEWEWEVKMEGDKQ